MNIYGNPLAYVLNNSECQMLHTIKHNIYIYNTYNSSQTVSLSPDLYLLPVAPDVLHHQHVGREGLVQHATYKCTNLNSAEFVRTESDWSAGSSYVTDTADMTVNNGVIVEISGECCCQLDY